MATTIIIAEEDGSVRRMVARVLETAGYLVVQASTWREAMARSSGAPDASLLMVNLEMLPQAARGRFEPRAQGFGGMPVIGITGWPDQFREAVRWGVDALMEKPLDLDLLLATIQQLLARSKPLTAPAEQAMARREHPATHPVEAAAEG